jgi:hypothetical protein
MSAQWYWPPYPDPSTRKAIIHLACIDRSNPPSRLKYGDKLYWTFICKCHTTKLLNSFCWLSSINNLAVSEPKHQKESYFSFLLSSFILTSILLSLFWKKKEVCFRSPYCLSICFPHILSNFRRNKRRLQRLLYCMWVPPPPPNTLSFSMRFVSYQRLVGDSSSKKSVSCYRLFTSFFFFIFNLSTYFLSRLSFMSFTLSSSSLSWRAQPRAGGLRKEWTECCADCEVGGSHSCDWKAPSFGMPQCGSACRSLL